jgi:penicillin amidase
LRDHSAPSLNFVYADRDGNIGYCLAGNLPAASKNLPCCHWQVGEKKRLVRLHSVRELPRVYNPPEGAIASANNGITTALSLLPVAFFRTAQRCAASSRRLGARQKLSAEELANIQLDDVSLHARELIETLRADIARIADQDQTAKEAAKRLCYLGRPM